MHTVWFLLKRARRRCVSCNTHESSEHSTNHTIDWFRNKSNTDVSYIHHVLRVILLFYLFSNTRHVFDSSDRNIHLSHIPVTICCRCCITLLGVVIIIVPPPFFFFCCNFRRDYPESRRSKTKRSSLVVRNEIADLFLPPPPVLFLLFKL